jgi:hypothetical protein
MTGADASRTCWRNAEVRPVRGLGIAGERVGCQWLSGAAAGERQRLLLSVASVDDVGVVVGGDVLRAESSPADR